MSSKKNKKKNKSPITLGQLGVSEMFIKSVQQNFNVLGGRLKMSFFIFDENGAVVDSTIKAVPVGDACISALKVLWRYRMAKEHETNKLKNTELPANREG